MGLRLGAVCIDAADPPALAGFWCAALGADQEVDEDGDVVVVPRGAPAGSPVLLFLGVPEVKTRKNRLHLDLVPDDQPAEVSRLEGLGATRTSVGQGEDVSWVVMADPEANEFCVLAPDGG